jgi:hypothetical protein
MPAITAILLTAPGPCPKPKSQQNDPTAPQPAHHWDPVTVRPWGGQPGSPTQIGGLTNKNHGLTEGLSNKNATSTMTNGV